jgi:hypothetical protein
VDDPVGAVEERYSRGALLAAVVVMASWHLVASLPTVLQTGTSTRAGMISATLWVVYAIIGAVTTVAVLRGGGRTAGLPLIVTPLLLGGVVATALANLDGSILDRYNWAFTSVGWFALVALWRRRLAELVGFFAANAGIGLAVLVAAGDTDRTSLTRFAMTCYGISVLQITIFVGGRAVTTLARRIALAQDAQSHVATRQRAAQAVHQARRGRYQTVQQIAADLLAGLADNTLDLADPHTQQRLRVAVTRLRRLIMETDDVPDPLIHELRACADSAERRGVAVDLQPPVGVVPTLPRDIRRTLAEPVIQVLAATRSRARITVVAHRADLTVGIVADAPDPAPHSALTAGTQVHYDAEEGLLWAQTRWRDRSPSLS